MAKTINSSKSIGSIQHTSKANIQAYLAARTYGSINSNG